MKNLGRLLGLAVLVVAVAALAAQQDAMSDKNFSWRYKMTVEIETPEGIKTGSAIRDVNIYWKVIGWSKINKQPHYAEKIDIDGEAVVVDLGKRGKIFALIKDTAYTDVINAFNIPRYEDIEKLPVGSKAEFDVSKYPGGPTLVTFTDINDPKTVMPVMVWSKNEKGTYVLTEDHMREVFGDGVKLKAIYVEITNEAINRIISKYLPKYTEDFWEWFQTLKYGDSRRITDADFK